MWAVISCHIVSLFDGFVVSISLLHKAIEHIVCAAMIAP